MDQDKIIERITTLEANQYNMKDQMRRFEVKQDDLVNNMNKLSECVIRIEGKIDALQNSNDNIEKRMDNMQEQMDEMKEDIKNLQDADRIHIMKDIIKPLVISAVSGGGIGSLVVFLMNNK